MRLGWESAGIWDVRQTATGAGKTDRPNWRVLERWSVLCTPLFPCQSSRSDMVFHPGPRLAPRLGARLVVGRLSPVLPLLALSSFCSGGSGTISSPASASDWGGERSARARGLTDSAADGSASRARMSGPWRTTHVVSSSSFRTQNPRLSHPAWLNQGRPPGCIHLMLLGGKRRNKLFNLPTGGATEMQIITTILIGWVIEDGCGVAYIIAWFYTLN